MRPKRMNSYIYIFGILAVCFVVYFFIKDKLFASDASDATVDSFEVPGPASIEVRQAPIYPPRNISSSGPNSPNQQPGNETVVYGEPGPKDPYYESQESSEIPENLRHPERSFRPPPLNNNTSIAVDAGVASNTGVQSGVTPEFIQGGGEFMPGIFANDTLSDKSYSSF